GVPFRRSIHHFQGRRATKRPEPFRSTHFLPCPRSWFARRHCRDRASESLFSHLAGIEPLSPVRRSTHPHWNPPANCAEYGHPILPPVPTSGTSRQSSRTTDDSMFPPKPNSSARRRRTSHPRLVSAQPTNCRSYYGAPERRSLWRPIACCLWLP